MAHNPYRNPPFGGRVGKKASSGEMVYRMLLINTIPVLINGKLILFGV